MKKGDRLKIGDAFMFPFNRAKGLLNIFWLLFPIFGWFALGGYVIRIIKGFTKGEFEKLPVMKFGSDMKLGFFMFLKAIPFMIAYAIVVGILTLIPGGFIVQILIEILAVPILFINFFSKETINSLFEFDILRAVFSNLWDYIVAMLKDILLAIIFFVMWIVLVGIPAGTFTQTIFLADFYRRRVK